MTTTERLRIDLHNHTEFCNHAKGSMEEFIIKAIDEKIDVFGFSDHGYMEFDKRYRMSKEQSYEYEFEVKRLKEKYSDKIEILLGYEVDFLDGYMEDSLLNRNVDYLIGSIHFINKWGFDNPEFIGEYQKKDIDSIWEEYFEIVSALAKSSKFDIIGHLDLIKVFKFMPKRDIKSIAYKSLKTIKESNMVLEINSAGWRKPIGECYPSEELLKVAFELDIPITFGSDAHEVSQINQNMEKSKAIARAIGYNKCVKFHQRDRVLVKF
jgi:histidinol-phosphatase (PHP family)